MLIYTKLHENCYSLIVYTKKASQIVKTDEILTVLLQLCTRFTGKMHSFSANQKRVMFLSILLHELSGSVTRDRFYHTVSFGLLLM